MAALERAVAVPAMDDVAVGVGQELDLDVPGPVDELLEIDAGVLEGGLGLVAGGLEGADEALFLAADAHPPAAAAGRGLDQDGVADGPGQAGRLGVAGDGAVGAGDAGDLGGGGDQLGLGLQAHPADRLVGGADELEVAAPADLGEMRVLAQEAVAGMDRLDVGHLGRGDQAGDVQVAVGARGLADADGPVGQREVRGVAVGLGVDGDDLDAQLLAGSDDPESDLAAVGHQDPLEHRRIRLEIGAEAERKPTLRRPRDSRPCRLRRSG